MGNTCKSQCQDRSITITLPDEEVRKKEAQLNALSNEPTKSTNAKGLKDMAKEKTQAKNDSDESSNDEDDDYYDPGTLAKLQIQNKGKNPRISVSAESYGAFNKKSDFKAKVIPKTSDQKNRIKLRISQAFMFAALEEKDLTVVIDAMEEKLVAPTDWVIKQGESGDHLYVVDSGELDCYKKYPNDTEPRHLKVYVPGESFGELALLYNAPRQASIQCKTRAVLFSLDRDTFNHIVKDSAMKKRQNYEDFLAKIELLTSMEAYERGKIAEAIKTLKFKQGESVVKEVDSSPLILPQQSHLLG
jgi:cAMP-dependent protein kinase regulator